MKKTIILLSVLLLAGCGSVPKEIFEPKETVRVISQDRFPSLPPVPPVNSPSLLPWDYDLPRDTRVTTIKNITNCVNVPESEQDEQFWDRCGENPILTDSNIYIGLTQENFNILSTNFKKLQETIFLYQQRIEQVNRQREEWREQNRNAQREFEKNKAELTSENE